MALYKIVAKAEQKVVFEFETDLPIQTHLPEEVRSQLKEMANDEFVNFGGELGSWEITNIFPQ